MTVRGPRLNELTEQSPSIPSAEGCVLQAQEWSDSASWRPRLLSVQSRLIRPCPAVEDVRANHG
eukprot:14856463-Alexandrium_andersonii.AAC.1